MSINVPNPDPRPFAKEWAAWTRNKSVNDLQADYASFAAGCEAGIEKHKSAMHRPVYVNEYQQTPCELKTDEIKAQLEAMRWRAEGLATPLEEATWMLRLVGTTWTEQYDAVTKANRVADSADAALTAWREGGGA